MTVVKFMRPTRSQRVQMERAVEAELDHWGMVMAEAASRIKVLHQVQDNLLAMDDQDHEQQYGGRR